MKTIEQKAKAYDKALEKARQLCAYPTTKPFISDLQDLFPELKESEDERVKRILHSISSKMSFHLRDIFTEEEFQCFDAWSNAWLEKQTEVVLDKDDIEAEEEGIRKAFNKIWDEKQGEQKPAVEMKTPEESLDIDSDTYNKVVDECIYDEQKSQRMISAEAKEAMYGKPTDKVEPKFKVDDWVVYYRNDSSREILQVYDIRDGRYYFTDNVHFSWSVKECDEKSHLWTIQDAKDGDILVCGKEKRPFIFKGLLDKFHPNNPVVYCGINCGNEFCIPVGISWWTDEEIEPATKEQCDLLFQKMKEAGYEWDADKKELKLLITNGGDFESENCEQNPAWSEEDERSKNTAIQACKDMVENYENSTKQYEDAIDWLKSLKNRYTWKPSDEQIEILDMVLTNESLDDNIARILRELKEQLKRLREE